MTKALYNLGIELCDELAAFAPRTRPKRIKSIDLTAASLEVRGARLRALLDRTFAGGVAAEGSGTLEEAVTRILEILAEWQARGDQPAELTAAANVIRERGELILSLHRRQVADIERISGA